MIIINHGKRGVIGTNLAINGGPTLKLGIILMTFSWLQLSRCGLHGALVVFVSMQQCMFVD